jgi:DNA-binding transcriptional MerR regulator/methylmalonyl-CoA mutase cobalamin-binding subunit
MPETSYLTIGEFSRRVGVSVELLRAWERRYGVPRPERTANGRRLYTHDDERAVGAMRTALARGLPAAEAARVAATAQWEAPRVDGDGELSAITNRLRDALARYDDGRAQEELDRLFGAYTVDTAIATVILPLLEEVGTRWAADEIGVEQEHFASHVIHGRLLSLGRKWDSGHGPRALLACPPGELHTMGLLCFGLALRSRGWRITYLGADTPVHGILEVASVVDPARIVLSSVDGGVLTRAAESLAPIAAKHRLAIAGAGATPGHARRLGAELLGGDPVAEAATLV